MNYNTTLLQSSRLCASCRCLEPEGSICPSLSDAHVSAVAPGSTPSPLSENDMKLMEELKKNPSALCERCASYDIMDFFDKADPPEGNNGSWIWEKNQEGKWERGQTNSIIALGRLNYIHLSPSCPLCRLIYCITPQNMNLADESIALTPFHSQTRQSDGKYDTEETMRTGIFFSITDLAMKIGTLSSNETMILVMTRNSYYAFGLESQSATPKRSRRNVRRISPTIDFSYLEECLSSCRGMHGNQCAPVWDDALLQSRMIDVVKREVVPCPQNCDYLALSYVWGGVEVKAGQLSNGTLPQTIEDAITVTRMLHKRYLWVDALCVDQTPTSDQATQLAMMGLIYNCASATIIALFGTDANSGLPGVRPRLPRLRQVEEEISERTLLTVPPNFAVEIMGSKWMTRAWTMQEGILSQRSISFTEHQIFFSCMSFSKTEVIDYGDDVEWDKAEMSYRTMRSIVGLPADLTAEPTTEGTTAFAPFFIYIGAVVQYTSRNMTYDRDSLNAFQSILSMWKRFLFPEGFSWGLPIFSHPQSLSWFHVRAATPRRRPGFPTWSWSGWAGEIMYPGSMSSATEIDDLKQHDLLPEILDVVGEELNIKAWTVVLDIRTEPFSEAYIPGTDTYVGIVSERNFLHNNTLPSCTYECLVLARVKEASDKEVLYLLLLERNGRLLSRKTFITLRMPRKLEFATLGPILQVNTLV